MRSVAKHFLVLLNICLVSNLLFAQALTPSLTIESAAAKVLIPFIQKEAKWAIEQQPVTITAASSSRSSGGKHDFFSEGDYWWPNPKSADSPYIQRDGMTNPDNFIDHRKAMIRFSRIMGSLASAYLTSKKELYAEQAFRHARAWFIDTATLMNPHLLYAQAIKGRFTGRGIGIIDMIQMMEVSQALIVLEKSKSAKPAEYVQFRAWFDKYLNWVTHHKYGIEEMNALNNHGTCWTMQVAGFARFTENDSLLNLCRQRYTTLHLPGQMAADGSFPKELARTKPYGYYMALGRMAAMADNTDRALTLVDEAIDAWGQADQPREQGFAWFIRCCVLVNADRFDEGLEAIAKAGALYAEVAAPDFWRGDIAKSRATCHRGLGNMRAAHDDFLEARRLFELSGNDHAAAHVALEAAECTKEADVVMENLTWARDVFARRAAPSTFWWRKTGWSNPSAATVALTTPSNSRERT